MSEKVYEIVTSKIIEQLEKGIIPWKKPWNNGGAINYITRKPYRGINRILLDMPGEYLTYNQIKSLGGYVKKGAKKHMIVFTKVTNYKVADAEEDSENKDSKIKRYYLLRYYYVFHLSDVGGIESKIVNKELNPIEEAEKIIKEYADKPQMQDADNERAYYSPMFDYINVPPMKQFKSAEGYYSVLFHESIHSTGNMTRLGRFTKETASAAFGSESYSKEELIAEIGAAMLCGVAGIVDNTINNSVAYIQSWLHALKNDKKLVVQAAAAAQKASDYILGITPEPDTEE